MFVYIMTMFVYILRKFLLQYDFHDIASLDFFACAAYVHARPRRPLTERSDDPRPHAEACSHRHCAHMTMFACIVTMFV